MVEALRAEYKLCEILTVAGMAKSGYEYARSAQAKGEAEGHAAARKAVIEAFGAGGGTYGYGRVYAQASADAGDGAAIGEWTVRDIMRDEGLVACAARKKRRYSSYGGEISEAPENLLRDERGRHRFHADKPNELWITVSVNIFFTIFTNVPPPFPPMIFYRSRQRTSAAFGQLPAAPFPSSSNARSLRR